MTMNSRPFTSQMAGGAEPTQGNVADQSSAPVSLSNARIFESRVPAQNTRPPAVTLGPPKFSVPVFATPFRASSGYSPNGTFHNSLPEFRSRQLRVPQGGLLPG